MKTVKIVHMKAWGNSENKYVTEHSYAVKERFDHPYMLHTVIEVDIPDRFRPIEDEEGRVIVRVGGKTIGLSNVLGVGQDGGPMIEWIDEEGGFKRTVSLKQHMYHFRNGGPEE